MRTPTLQILTARRLTDCELPHGWQVCAAIDDRNGDEDYDVDTLDQALLSRFLRVKVVADLTYWLSWAHSKLHPKLVAFAEAPPQLFDDQASNPRPWTRASEFFRVWEASERRDDVLVTGLANGWGIPGPWRFCSFVARPMNPCVRLIFSQTTRLIGPSFSAG